MCVSQQISTTKVANRHLFSNTPDAAGLIGLSIPTELTATAILRQRANDEGVLFIHQPNEVKVMKKNCDHCGLPFPAKTKRAKYCGDVCRAAANRAKVKQGAKQKKVLQKGLSRRGKTAIRIISDCYEKRFKGHSRFVTLTLRNIIPDEETVKRLLDNFLKRLRRIRPKAHYIWVAERQKRGTIHFHILTPEKIVDSIPGETYQDFRQRENEWVNKAWNEVVMTWARRSGKITNAQYNQWKREYQFFEIYYQQLTQYKQGKGAKPEKPGASSFMLTPNCIEVQNPGRYMAKYMSKGNENLIGNLWNCSQESRQFLDKKERVSKDVDSIYQGNQIIEFIERRAAVENVFLASWELPHNNARGVWCRDSWKLLQWYYEFLELHGERWKIPGIESFHLKAAV